jgi:DNA repair protein RecO (recombination protein O)
MAVFTSEAVVLRTWPVQESDLIVSLFTRDYGRLRGVAKAALKSRKRFGGALEPMTVARAWFAERPRQDLVRLDQLEIIRSPLSAPVDQTRMTVLSFYSEVIDEALPERDPQETVFRLLVAVLEQTRAVKESPRSPNARDRHPTDMDLSVGTLGRGHPDVESVAAQPWMALTYFLLWMTRLMGLLPDLAHCIVCGEPLRGAEVSYSGYTDGLFCGLHRNGNANALSEDSWQLALRMLKSSAAAFAGEPWTRRRAQDLRRFTLQTLERHLERRLKTAEALARLGG